MSRKKTVKKQDRTKKLTQKKTLKTKGELLLFTTPKNLIPKEILHMLSGLSLGIIIIGILYISIDNRNIRTAFASSILGRVLVEDESQTDAEAEYIVTEEQKRLAEEYQKNPIEPSGTMRNMPQYVVFAFDGSKSLDMWEETRMFAKQMNESGSKIHFTYFINPIYLLTAQQAKEQYQPPRRDKGQSAIGYSENDIDTIKRRQQIRVAQTEGHEIASHAVGHYNGADWSLEEWRSELRQFDKIFYDGHTISKNSVTGFRAPSLGQNKDLFIALSELGYSYDTSLVGMARDLPKHEGGLWEFPVATIIFGRDEKPVLSMDYSIFMHQTKAKNIAFKGTELWQNLYDETMYSYQKYFDDNYNGNHAPVYIAHHFSKWNDGVYFEVMKDFAKNVCSKKDVKCVTYSELQRELEKNLIEKEQ